MPNSDRKHTFARCGILIPAAVWRWFAPELYAVQLQGAKKAPNVDADRLAVVDSAFVNVRRSQARVRPRTKCTIFVEREVPMLSEVEVPTKLSFANALFQLEEGVF